MSGAGSVGAIASRLYAERRERDGRLGGYAELMGEPAWDLLLYLTAADCGSEGACGGWPIEPLPHASGLHWIAVLHRLGLAERRASGGAGGRPVALSPEGRALMTRVLGLDQRDRLG